MEPNPNFWPETRPSVSYKPAFKVQGEWSYNAQRFATHAEALASASDRFMVWTMPTEYAAHPSDDPVNYHRWDGRDVSGIEPTPEQCEARARAVCVAFRLAGELIAEIHEVSSEPLFLVGWEREVSTGNLPDHIRVSLLRAGYTLQTVRLTVGHDRIRVSSHANDGQMVTLVSTVRGKDGAWRHFTERGNWGGHNPFTQSTIDATPVRTIPDGGCIVEARTARNRSNPWVTLHVRALDALSWLSPDAPELTVARDVIEAGRNSFGRPSAVARCNAADLARAGLASLAAPSITEHQRAILKIYKGIKSSYRKSEIARVCSENDASIAIESLVAAGMLKRARNGATSITTDGVNALL